MSIKIYEAETLVNAMEERARQYSEFRDQLNHLKKEFSNIVNFDDEFQGKGAESIKGFFQAQIDVVDSWLRLVDRQIAFFTNIAGDVEEEKLGGQTIVQVPFLEEELANANNMSIKMVEAQQDDLQKIFDRIDDLVPLKVFSVETFGEKINQAEQQRTNTIQKVHEQDQALLADYEKSEADQATTLALMEQIQGSSIKGGQVSSLFFDAKSYKSSNVYKDLQDRKRETSEYLSIKKAEAEERRIEKLQKQLASVNDPDEYLKIAKEIGYDNLTDSQQSMFRQLEMAQQNAEIGKGIGRGLFDVGKDLFDGVKDLITDPFGTMEGVDSIIHPVDTAKYIANAIEESFKRDMINGDAYSRSRWVTYALGTVVTSVVGTKGTTAVVKTGVADTRKVARKVADKTNTAAKQISIQNLLPYNLNRQVALDGGVPYNTVNSVNLKEQLISKAKAIVGVRVEYGNQYTKVNRKKTLKPNVEYTTRDGYKYNTDSNGRITVVEAKLELGKAGRNPYAQRIVGGNDRVSNDDGGHLIASIFKGSGDIDNLVPMNATLNRSEYETLENTWKKALTEGKVVTIKIKPLYEGQSMRPSEFNINYTIDGKKYSDRLTNYTGGTQYGN
ncbi:TIGR01741 family protein [Peribacillus cavernae]|uniref:TIGR01741 family protein n=1 Tax=Peribacillus cavernae TaxID=1674310 RepID=A0A433HGQ0_9BACI|nr:T7SS effector LXG polymorphic toxin [Peribacillus cavernae]MDQ0221348.1 putative ribonuclease toxin of YeeF-YezG toxin-antitoxin module [Peribacillus cavernae]RUQ27479.1 TIGR01741 family protein [Peribacillus cavernae]